MSTIDDNIETIMSDIPAFHAKCDAAAREQFPDITQAELDASWQQMAEQFGLVEDAAPSVSMEPGELKSWADARAAKT